jgi:hypothetical protein
MIVQDTRDICGIIPTKIICVQLEIRMKDKRKSRSIKKESGFRIRELISQIENMRGKNTEESERIEKERVPLNE